jgi:hypothetical protein
MVILVFGSATLPRAWRAKASVWLYLRRFRLIPVRLYLIWAAGVVTWYAIGNGVDEDDAVLWLDQPSRADREGRFGFVSVPVLTTTVAV